MSKEDEVGVSKIVRLDSVTNFGSYRSFVWGDGCASDFKRYNLLYGWNYSGKTTLSRIVDHLRAPKLREGYEGASYQVTVENGGGIKRSIDHTDKDHGLEVRVFNRDFINDNFQQEHHAPSVHIIGDKAIGLKERLEILRKRRKNIEKYKQSVADTISIKQDALDKDKIDQARIISELLGDRTYNRTRLNNSLQDVNATPKSHLLTDSQRSVLMHTYSSAAQFQKLPDFYYPSLDLLPLLNDAKALLQQTADYRAIEELKNDKTLEMWLREAMQLHKGTETCRFCGNTIPPDVIQRYEGHFSAASEELRTKLEDMLKGLTVISDQYEYPDASRLLPEFKADYTKATALLSEWCAQCKVELNRLKQALEDKIKYKLNQAVVWSSEIEATSNQPILEKIEKLIDSHNERLSRIDEAKTDAGNQIERHFTASLIIEKEFPKRQKELDGLRSQESRASRIIEAISERKETVNQLISKSSIAVEKLNALLATLLKDSNIVVERYGDLSFQFKRSGSLATNLSDGERTAVAFAYFLITLEDKGTKLDDLIVFVDDPISSLDSNHIYAVWALINQRLMDCKQLFISTHNVEFFTLLKDQWVNRNLNFKETHAGYWIARKHSSDGSSQSIIEDLPSLLRKYKSEYQFVYACLYNFAASDSPSHHESYTCPSLLRKFLEAYLGFRKPTGGKWYEKLDLLIDDTAKRTEIQKFVNEASHLQNPARITEHPTYPSIAQELTKGVLKELENRDPHHYESLTGLVTGGDA